MEKSNTWSRDMPRKWTITRSLSCWHQATRISVSPLRAPRATVQFVETLAVGKAKNSKRGEPEETSCGGRCQLRLLQAQGCQLIERAHHGQRAQPQLLGGGLKWTTTKGQTWPAAHCSQHLSTSRDGGWSGARGRGLSGITSQSPASHQSHIDHTHVLSTYIARDLSTCANAYFTGCDEMPS
eukprot:scaffold169678_cov33-Prasinocladus_malaysianus.AAC.1